MKHSKPSIFIDGSVCYLSSAFNEKSFKRAVRNRFNLNDAQIIFYPNISGKNILTKLLQFKDNGVFDNIYDYVFLNNEYCDKSPYLSMYLNIFKKISKQYFLITQFIQNPIYTDNYNADTIIKDIIFKDKPEYLIYDGLSKKGYQYIHFKEKYESMKLMYDYLLKENLVQINEINEIKYVEKQTIIDILQFNSIDIVNLPLIDRNVIKNVIGDGFLNKSFNDLLYLDKNVTITINSRPKTLAIEHFGDVKSGERKIEVLLNGKKIHTIQTKPTTYFANRCEIIDIEDEYLKDKNTLELSTNIGTVIGNRIFIKE